MGKIAAILHEDPAQGAVGRPLSIVKNETRLQLGEGAGPGEV